MARIEVPITQITTSGVEPPTQVVGSSSENHFLPSNDGTLHLEVANADAAATHTVTIHANAASAVAGYPIENEVVTVGKSKTVLIKVPGPQAALQSNGQVFVDVASTELKLRCYRA